MSDESIKAILKDAIADRITPGCSVGIIVEDAVRFINEGSMRYGSTAPTERVDEDTIYDVASITKSVVTNNLALYSISKGLLQLDQKVVDLIPELQVSFASEVLIKHLLTYSLDFDLQLSMLKDLEGKEILRKVLTADLRMPPGRTYAYVNATSIVLGLVVERVLGDRLDRLASGIFFSPLQMKKTKFLRGVNDHQAPKIAPSEIDDWRGREIIGEVHDESAWQMQQAGLVPGSAGLFSTTRDLVQFMSLLIDQHQTLKRSDFWSDELVQAMYTDQLHLQKQQVGLGWELNQEWMGDFGGRNLIGKTGFTGCCVVADIENKVGVVVLCNHTYPKRNPDRTVMKQFRRQLLSEVFRSIKNPLL